MVPMSIHTIGGRAVKTTLNAFDASSSTSIGQLPSRIKNI